MALSERDAPRATPSEATDPVRPAPTDPAHRAAPDDSAVSRRQFVTGAAKAGTVVGVGAVVWTAPQIRSVALAQEAVGTPPPDDPVDPIGEIDDPPETGVPTDPDVVPVGDARPPVAGSAVPIAAADDDAPDGRLATTGSDPRALAVGGGLAAATGGALLALRNRIGRGRTIPEPPAS